MSDPKPLEPFVEGHPRIIGAGDGVIAVQHKPRVENEPILVPSSNFDGDGVSIYGSVLKDGGRYRMWYQVWPKKELKGGDSCYVACAESDDGLEWRRPSYGLLEYEGSRDNNLTNLPFHSPSVMIDPTAPPEARYRAFGTTGYRKRVDFPAGFDLPAKENYGFYTAHSADGLDWKFDSDEACWLSEDVITAVWDPYREHALVALKNNKHSAGMLRRRFMTATWSCGVASEAVTALVPDEYDDLIARSRGYDSADYYGVGLSPGPTITTGFLWNFRHQGESSRGEFGRWNGKGCVELELVYQSEFGGRWQHLPGRPDWVAARDMPDWASGALYTAASPIEMGDETWLYFTGTRDRHGWAGNDVDAKTYRKSERGLMRIGLLRWPRGRLFGFESRLRDYVRISPLTDGRQGLTLNADIRAGGRVRAELRDANLNTIPGFGFEDCEALTVSSLAHAFTWRGQQELPESASAQFEVDNATLYGFSY